MFMLRDPLQAPYAPPYPKRHICFRHPGYDDSDNVLLKLPASDDTGVSGEIGLFAQFAIDACAIIAGDTSYKGWLSKHKAPSDGDRVDPSSVLLEQSYYFHLGTSDPHRPYPVVPCFRHWPFPHGCLPSHWQELGMQLNDASPGATYANSNFSHAVTTRDLTCRISARREALQICHLIPTAELQWWKENGMWQYTSSNSQASLNDPANALLLYNGFHHHFDKPWLAFAPKQGKEGNTTLVVHLLAYSPELKEEVHNRPLRSSAISIEFLYARFAWTIFSFFHAFLECNRDRRLSLRHGDAKLVDENGFYPAAACQQFTPSAARKRSESPKKRKNIDAAAGSDAADNEDDPPRKTKRSRQKRKFDGEAETIPKIPTTPVKHGCRYSFDVNSTSSPPLTTSSLSTIQQSPSPSATRGNYNRNMDTRSWLAEERKRSCGQKVWAEEEDFLTECWNGKILASDDKVRLYEDMGFEIRDDES